MISGRLAGEAAYPRRRLPCSPPAPPSICRPTRSPRRSARARSSAAAAGPRPDRVEPDASGPPLRPSRRSCRRSRGPRRCVYEPAPFGLRVGARSGRPRALGATDRRSSAGRVVLTASTSEAYAFLFKLLCDPGDEVLVPRPSYPLFEHLARLEAVRAVPYRLAYDGAWHVDLASAARGGLATHARRRRGEPEQPDRVVPEARRARRRSPSLGLPIVSDEVFAPLPARARTRPRAALGARGARRAARLRARRALEARGAAADEARVDRRRAASAARVRRGARRASR